MKWDDFIKFATGLPVVNTENLLAGIDGPENIRVQISRWKASGRLIQLKRGMYLLPRQYRRVDIFEPYIAGLLKSPSYVSLEKALEYHNLIPEAVSVYTSVTPKRQARFENSAGIYDYRHIKQELFWGYAAVTVHKQTGFMATPEKALLDLFYFKRAPVDLDYLAEMRLQNLDVLNFDRLFALAKKFSKAKMLLIARSIRQFYNETGRGEKKL